MNIIKTSFNKLTVKIALGAVVLCFLCRYLPWLTEGKQSMSMVEAIEEKSSYFAGITAVLIVGFLWVIVFFLLNHPKLTLIGDVALLVVWLVFLMTASDYNLNLGFGAILHLILVIACIVLAFLTKKTKKAKAE